MSATIGQPGGMAALLPRGIGHMLSMAFQLYRAVLAHPAAHQLANQPDTRAAHRSAAFDPRPNSLASQLAPGGAWWHARRSTVPPVPRGRAAPPGQASRRQQQWPRRAASSPAWRSAPSCSLIARPRPGHSTGRTPMIRAMSEWFGWLQQKALADPFAKRYAQAPKDVLVVLDALVFVAFGVFLITYASIPERPPKSTDPTWADSVIVAQITIAFIVLGAGSVLAVLFASIRTSSPQPDWRYFPSLWSLRRKQGMALLSGASTFLGLGVASVLLILIFESVRSELAQHEKTLDALQEEVRRNQEAVAASREVAKAQETLERHGRFRRQQIVFLLVGALLGGLLGLIFGVVVDPAGMREHLPQWLTLFD
jgi:hypothetical protein